MDARIWPRRSTHLVDKVIAYLLGYRHTAAPEWLELLRRTIVWHEELDQAPGSVARSR